MNMIEEHPSYHQVITRDEAERRLRQHGSHCYLIRYTESQLCYVLSVYQHQRPKDTIQHFKIIFRENGGKEISGTGMTFSNIQSLLEHYEQNRLNYNFKNIGQAYSESEYLWDEEKKERLEEEKKREQRRIEEETEQGEESKRTDTQIEGGIEEVRQMEQKAGEKPREKEERRANSKEENERKKKIQKNAFCYDV